MAQRPRTDKIAEHLTVRITEQRQEVLELLGIPEPLQEKERAVAASLASGVPWPKIREARDAFLGDHPGETAFVRKIQPYLARRQRNQGTPALVDVVDVANGWDPDLAARQAEELRAERRLLHTESDQDHAARTARFAAGLAGGPRH